MSQTIELESIRRLDIKPGETLVATLPRDAHPRDIERAAEVLKDRLPDGVEVLVVSGNVDLSVLSADPCRSVPA